MADLTVTVTDSITISGRKSGSERVQTISGINHVVQGVVSIPNAAYFTLLSFDSAAAGIQQVANGTIKYARFTNTHASNPIFLSWGTTDGSGTPPDDIINVEIPAGCTFALSDGTAAANSSFTSTMLNLYRASARATGGAATMEVFYATT